MQAPRIIDLRGLFTLIDPGVGGVSGLRPGLRASTGRSGADRRSRRMSLQRQHDEGRLPHRPALPDKTGRLPAIDQRRCTGCGRCVAACAPHLLSLEIERWKKSAVLHNAERCTGCSACAVACPFHAIVMRRPAPAR
jgi:ferredoxin